MDKAISIKAAEEFESQVPCTYSELADYIFEALNLTVSNQLIRLTIKRSSQVKAILAHPMEADRVACSEGDIDAHFEQMPACLVCNLDEIGSGNTMMLNQSRWWHLATVLIGFLIQSIEPAAASQFSTEFPLMDPT
jgi:hypothetical protein